MVGKRRGGFHTATKFSHAPVGLSQGHATVIYNLSLFSGKSSFFFDMLSTMRPIRQLLLLALFAGSAFTESDYSNLKVLYNAIEKCSEDKDVGVCLKIKAIGIMDRALVQDEPLPLTDYVAIAKDPTARINDNVYNETETEIAARLPRSYEEKSSTLDQMLYDRLNKYLETRTLQLSIPTDILEGK